MSAKNCEECSESFQPSRASQRFCSSRCANRLRDRRRRHRAAGGGLTPSAEVQNGAAASTAHDGDSLARLVVALASSNQAQESLWTQLRCKSADLDHLEAENSEQRATITNLQAEIARLHAVQQADAQDMIHLASRHLAFSQATRVELDATTKELFRRRGWTTAARKTEAKQP